MRRVEDEAGTPTPDELRKDCVDGLREVYETTVEKLWQ
jgi:hypothetical protein